MNELGNTNTGSVALIRAHSKDIVRRYHASPAIWGWEFGNEPSLSADLPNAPEHRPPIVPGVGTPAKRTESDELKSSQLQVALLEFARSVRQFDSARPIFSGNALPRASAWHNTHQTNWTTDTRQQFREVLLRDNPDPLNAISVHVYPGEKFPAGAKTVTDIIKLTNEAARAAKKPLFIGEFGVSRRAGPIEEQKRTLAEILTALEESHVPLAAVWVFDYSSQADDWNISFENDRAVFLTMIQDANKRLVQKE
jgi:hypothetical protein